MKLLITQFSPTYIISSLFSPDVLLSILFLDAFSLCFPLNVRCQVSHPWKTTGRIIIFIF
jgi:hypothetical protein